MNALDLIAAERERQRGKWSLEHDDEHRDAELAQAAACYACPKPLFVHEKRRVQLNASRGIDENVYQYDYVDREGYWSAWPWSDGEGCNPNAGDADRVRRLVIAGALIVAELERLSRAFTQPPALAAEARDGP